MRHLLMLAYYFPPRGGSGVQRSLKFAKYLPEFGYEPVVITAALDEITQTFDQSLLEEIPEVPIYRAASGERRIRALARLRLGPLVSTFARPDAHIFWKRDVMKLAREVVPRHDCKAIYVSVQPWSSALIGLELKRKYGLPLVVDFRDPWTFSTSKAWPTRWHHKHDTRLEESVFRHADAIVSVTPGIIESYRERYPWAKDKIDLIYNGFDGEDFDGTTAASAGGMPLRIGFAGRLYDCEPKRAGIADRIRNAVEYRNCTIDFSTHSLKYLLEAIAQVVQREPESRKDLLVEVAGNVPMGNIELAERLGVSDMIRFHGVLPHSEAIKLVGRCDLVFLPMMSEADGRRSFNASGKIFEYLAQRKPVLAAVPEGDAADLVTKACCGWVIGGKDVPGQRELLRKLLEVKKCGALAITPDEQYIQSFERKQLTGKLSAVLNRVMSNSRKGTMN